MNSQNEKKPIEKKVDETWKETAKKEKETTKKEKETTKKDKEDKPKTAGAPPREINFSLFISSLGMQTLMHLGEIANPFTKKNEKDLTQAKQTIDIISVLKDKTKGNLTEEESKILDGLLYELRMKYVKVTE